MPLSEHEQRLLEQIERALYDEDPKFAHAYRNINAKRHHRSRLLRCAALFVAGLALLVAGVVVNLIVLGVAGFVVMLAAVTLAISVWQRTAGRFNSAGRIARTSRRGRNPLHRLEERWQRRQEERGDHGR